MSPVEPTDPVSTPTDRLIGPPTATPTAGRSGPDALTIGKRLRHRRQQQHLTLDAVAGRVGISVSALSLIETGRRWTSLKDRAALAALAGAAQGPGPGPVRARRG